MATEQASNCVGAQAVLQSMDDGQPELAGDPNALKEPGQLCQPANDGSAGSQPTDAHETQPNIC